MVILWAEIVQLAVASAWLRHFGQVIISSSPEKLFVGYHWAQKMYLARSLVSQDGLIVLGNDLEGRSIQGAPLWPQQREKDWESWVRSVRAASDAMASDVNTKQLEAKARSIDQQTDFDVMQQRRESKLFLGEQNANAAASSVTITSGSPLLKELDHVTQTEIQAQNIRAAGQNTAAATWFQSRMVRRQIPFAS